MAILQMMMGMTLGAILGLMLFLRTKKPIEQRSQQDYCSSPDKQKSLRDYCSSPDENCTICLEQMSNNERVYLPCGHALHKHCLADLQKKGDAKCPLCRKQI